MPSITEKTVLIRRTSLITTQVNADSIMMDIEAGKYFGLNTIASEIWNKIENPIQVSDICSHLLAISDVELLDCSEQTIAFLEQLNSKNLIEIVSW